jgi:methenyltetrahydrofolate cyclohydrolase
MLQDLTIQEFLERVASGEPVPGGGCVAALAAALSAALCGMVGGLTLGRKGNPDLDARMATLVEAASRLRVRLMDDIDRDAEAYGLVLKAYRMAKGTGPEREVRLEAIQNALTEAALVPLSVAEAGVVLLSLAEDAVTEGNPNAITDAVVGALMARSAVIGALYNVKVNLSLIRDESVRTEIERKTDGLEKEAMEREAKILSLARTAMERKA